MSDTLHRLAENPFYVLGLRPGCARAEVEREGQKLLAMLELKLSAAATYASPVGKRTRTVDNVRHALAELRDPEKRLGHELWARLAPVEAPADGAAPPDSDGERLAPWPHAPVALGWRPR
jgi:hypothetical protein